jgi:hypothetical protein
MVCTRCGIIGADAAPVERVKHSYAARPNWRERPVQLSGAGTAPWQ